MTLPYFPLNEDDPARMAMGTQALGDRPVIEIDPERYLPELAEKTAILAEDYRYYFQAPTETEPAAWEVIELILPELAERHPDRFSLDVDGATWTFRNHALGSVTAFTFGDAATLPYPPLDWVGRQVQEDLIVMGNDVEHGFPLVAGQLCFASGWDLDEMMGRSFLSIHEDVARFAEEIGRPAYLLMARLKPERPVWRANWSIKTNDRLNSGPRFRELNVQSRQGITAENTGQRCYFRVERQVLARLPRTGAVLFTIHTYLTRLDELASDPDRARRLAHAVRGMHPATYAYKGLATYAEGLLAYLDAAAARVGVGAEPAG